MKLSIVIPVYNEAATIPEIIKRVKETPFEKEILIIDDGSRDGTRDVLQSFQGEPDIQMFFHSENKGKGAALRTGFEKITGDIVLIQDADLEYTPQDYPKLLEPIMQGEADVVYGSRFLGGPHRVLFFWHYLGNQFLTFFSNMFTNINLTDMETGYKVFRREVLDKIHIRSNRFGFEPEFTAKVAKNKFRIYEVPVSYFGRDYAQGKKITWKDGVVALFLIIWFKFFD